MSDVLDIAGSLRGQRIFVTGGTGFLGKVLVEKVLWSIPDVEQLLLLVRPSGAVDATTRLHEELLDSPIMARLRARHGDEWRTWAMRKIRVVSGDLGQDRFGLDDQAYSALCRDIDRVIAGAATVNFDERIDLALELNVRGAQRTLTLCRDAGNAPLVHVSTCYVSGRRKGSIAERLVTPEAGDDGPFDVDKALAALDAACHDLRADSALLPGEDAPFVAAGQQQATRFGFHDIYTLTKALAELLVDRERGAVPVAIVRPAIVESAALEPIPGWIEGIRVSDPLLVAYGRGRTRDIPGAADVALELVPVDFVAHTILAALVDLTVSSKAVSSQAGRSKKETRSGNEGEIPVYQVGSSRHPITLGELMSHAREGFTQTPLRDEDGTPITVEPARFVEPGRLVSQLAKRQQRLRTWAQLAPARFTVRTTVGERLLEHFARLIEIYRPYLSHGASYQDDATCGLWRRLSDAEKADFPFDITALDWRSYISRTHVPGLIRFALKADSGAPPPNLTSSKTQSSNTRPSNPPIRPISERQRQAEERAASAETLFELFASVARAHPDVMAFQTCRKGHWLRYTYGQALTTTANIARRLQSQHGIGIGDRVVLCSSGCPEWVLTTFAVHRLGATIVPLDPQWPAGEIVQAASLVKARLICVAVPLVAGLSAKAGEDFPVVALAEPFVPSPDVPLLSDRPDRESPETPEAAASDSLAAILFTSGTTVAPKAVPLTHANYLANVRDLVPLMALSRDRLLSVLPIHHTFEQMVGLFVPLAGASTISYVAEIKPAEISWMMNTTRPTVLVAVPRLLELLHGGIFQSVKAGGPMLGRLFKVLFALSRLTGARYGHRLFGKVHRRFGGSLRRIATGGSALEPSLGRSFQLMGFRVAEGYGMTETSPVLAVNPWNALRFGAAGRPLPGVEFELRPPAEATGVAPGSGEVWVRGVNVMAGYYENPEATDLVMQDGWLNTGDIGYFDEHGYIVLSGRTKDVIVTAAGKNVYPEEVELRYADIDGVQELIVLGIPYDRLAEGGAERVTALVIPRPGATEQELEQIRSAIDERSAQIPSYQQASRVEFWRGALPKTTTMKVKRGLLRDAVIAGQRGDGDAPAPATVTEAPELSADQAWVMATLAVLTGTRADQLGPADRLADLGVDSLTRVELVAAMEAHFGFRLDDAVANAMLRVQDLLAQIPQES